MIKVTIEGNTPDFYWYEGHILCREIKALQARLEHITQTFQARSKEQIALTQHYFNECSRLRAEIVELKKVKPKPRKPRKGAKQ